jgi:hypothetical protein
MEHKAFRQLVRVLVVRYEVAGKKQKSVILNELCATAELNRNYASRLLKGGHKKNRSRPGRPSKYAEPGFRLVLTRFWSATEYLCGKLLKVAIPKYLPFYEGAHESLKQEHIDKLLSISPATIDRVLHPDKAKRGFSLTRRGKMFREEIQIRCDYWSEVSPGFMEGDSVAHCGGSMKGPFIWTMTFVDIATTWVETRAVWTLNGENTVNALRCVRAKLPFPMIALDFDNGGEFINNVVVRFCATQEIALTRSRPYHKNDNAHVEQKNDSVVRQLLGYGRFENPDLVPVMNDLYINEWYWYNNFFRPSFKLKDKTKVGSKYRRKYDTPKTPYERVLESPMVDQKRKDELTVLYNSLNPFQLRKAMHEKFKRIHKLSKITFEQWQNSQQKPFDDSTFDYLYL